MEPTAMTIDESEREGKYFSKRNTPASESSSSATEIEHSGQRETYARKPKRAWSVGEMSTPQDSGSESAPLLSSESRTSFGPVIFQDSETSDPDSSPYGSSPRYGSVGGSSLGSVICLPKSLPRLIRSSPLVTPSTANLVQPSPYSKNQYYDVGNLDLVLGNVSYDGTTLQNAVVEVTGAFLPGPLPLLQENPSIPLKDTRSTQNSLVTIFSIWNTILGSSLLTMPWGIAMAGLFPGIGLMLIMGGLCLYTAHKLLQVQKYYGGSVGEVTELSRALLGAWAEYIARIFSITVLLGANIAYWILMTNFLYYTVNFIYDSIVGLPIHPPFNNGSFPIRVLCPKQAIFNESDVSHGYEHSYDNIGPIWDLYKTVPLFLAVLIFPLLNFSSANFFMKLNSFGTISIAFLIAFVLIKSSSWGVNMDDTAWEESWKLRPTFPALSGMLALSFFIHNIIITIMQNNRYQKNNGRDLIIAYFLVAFTYIVVGAVFYICFPLAKSCIEDNLLNNFQKGDSMTVGIRIVLLFQLLTVYPLIAYMLRIQLLSTICKTSTYVTSYVFLINITTIIICVLFAVFMPRVGTIIRFTGAMSGFIYVFTLPSLLHLASMYRQRKLTVMSAVFHLCVPLIGSINLLAQLFVTDK